MLSLVLLALLGADGDDAFARERELRTAAYKADVERVKALLAGGANVNYQDPKANKETALFTAANRGHVEVVRLLLAVGADPNLKTHLFSNTPLLVAGEGGHAEVARLLVAAKADLNARFSNSFSTLELAAGRGHVEVVKVLLEAGADLRAASPKDRSALARARGCADDAKAAASTRARCGEVVVLLEARNAPLTAPPPTPKLKPTGIQAVDAFLEKCLESSVSEAGCGKIAQCIVEKARAAPGTPSYSAGRDLTWGCGRKIEHKPLFSLLATMPGAKLATWGFSTKPNDQAAPGQAASPSGGSRNTYQPSSTRPAPDPSRETRELNQYKSCLQSSRLGSCSK